MVCSLVLKLGQTNAASAVRNALRSSMSDWAIRGRSGASDERFFKVEELDNGWAGSWFILE